MSGVADKPDATRALLRAVVESVADAVVTIDSGGVIRTFNPAAESIFGYAAEEVLGRDAALLVAEADREATRAYLAQLRRDGTERSGTSREMHGRRKDGTEFPVELSVGEVRHEDTGLFVGVVRDVTAKKRAEEALRRSEERFQLAVAGSTDALWDWDVVSNEVWYAPRFKEILGYSDDEFPNVFGSFESHLHPDDRDVTLQRVAEHLEHRRPYDVEYRLRTKSGEWRWIRARGQALWNGAGEPYRMAGSISDITEHKRSQELLARAKELAEAASAAKSQFLANMSHELRTPLNAIIGYSELLEEEAGDRDDPSTVEDLRKIARAGHHLLGLINDVLDLSKVEAGKMELDPERFDLAEMLHDTEATVEPLFAERGNSLELVTADGVGAVTLDRTRLRQIVLNLLSNANKFTDKGTVRLSARREAGAGQDRLVLTVTDTGIGMTPEQLSRIFEPFSQADGSTTRRHGGTGLGLTICRRLCEMMGGSIEAESEPDRSSTFTVRLPLAETAPSVAPAASAERPAAVTDANADTVLVIDDDPDVRELMSRVLSKEGYAVVTAASGEEGLELARRARPRVITLDVMMPGMDGWSVLARLKDDAELRHIPVVLVTMIDDHSLGLALGAADYLVKPIKRQALAAALGRYRSGAAPGTVLVVEDSKDVRDLVRRTLGREGWRVVEAADGVEGLQRVGDASPDVVLLDLMMPRMDGFEFLEKLRTRPEQQRLPVLVLTAKSLTTDERRRLSGSVERILQKGAYRREELLAEVARQVHRYAQLADGAAGGRG